MMIKQEREGVQVDQASVVKGDSNTSVPIREELLLIAQQQEDDHELAKEESVHDVSYHPGEIILYSAPKQRQKWGDTQILPRVNWGDTFYDLFFVAAAYNVGNIVVNSPSWRGLLYMIGCFFPVMTMWRDKTYYDARFVVGDDLSHRVFEVIFFVTAAAGVLHIASVDIMSHTRDYPEMFAFSLVLALFSCWNFVGYVELYFLGQGEGDVVKRVAVRDIGMRLVPFILQVAAATLSGIEYFVHGAGASSNSSSEQHRMLAGDSKDTSFETAYVNDIPIWLCLGSFVSHWIYMVTSVQFLFPNDGSHKQSVVPLNVAFAIHRDGEWIMLILGESILSLLIVDVHQGSEYYTTFYCGILTVVLLQYLHYRSQPYDPNFHAMRRNKDAGVWWGYTNMVYSASYILVGVSYKLFLYEFSYEPTRRLEYEEDERLLAVSSGLASLTTEERQQAAANVFGIAMAAVFACLDIMILLHRGLKGSLNRCQCPVTKKRNKGGILLVLSRIVLVVFFATLSQYENDPNHLSLLGLAGVVVQLLIRRLGFVFFIEEKKHQGDDHSIDLEESKWPNVTRPAVMEVDDEREQDDKDVQNNEEPDDKDVQNDEEPDDEDVQNNNNDKQDDKDVQNDNNDKQDDKDVQNDNDDEQDEDNKEQNSVIEKEYRNENCDEQKEVENRNVNAMPAPSIKD